jgi:hypothetical protein
MRKHSFVASNVEVGCASSLRLLGRPRLRHAASLSAFLGPLFGPVFGRTLGRTLGMASEVALARMWLEPLLALSAR